MPDLTRLSIRALRDGYRRREFSATEVVDAHARKIERIEPDIHAMVSTRFEAAIHEATSLDRPPAERLPLHGIPFVVKDLLDVGGLPTRCGSRTRAAAPPAVADAAAVARLRSAGAILLGKTRSHEFGWGITTVADDGTATANPANLERVAGGSSGGSAAALAAFETPLALGTDTAGSVRIPADFCGVVGLRPTRGAISGSGAFALAPSLDEVGPMTRTADDAAIAFAVLAPPDPRSTPHARDPESVAVGLRIGLSADLQTAETVSDRDGAVRCTAALLMAAGAELTQLSLPLAREAFEVLGTIILVEGLTEHRRRGLWPAHADEYGRDVQQRLRIAEGVPPADYVAAQRLRKAIQDEMATAFAVVDILLSPVSGAAPIPRSEGSGDQAFRQAVMGCTAVQSLCGLPACAVPVGVDRSGLPVGIQVTGRPGADRDVLDVARAIAAIGVAASS